jgi:methyl-accepting chemotaxis protein
MLNRVTISALLKAVIALFGAAVVIMLSLGAWDSWGRLSGAGRSAAITSASADLFTALHFVRTDRALSDGVLLADAPQQAMSRGLREARDAEVPALRSALAVLADVDFPSKASYLHDLADHVERLTALHQETSAAMQQPKAARRPGVAQDMHKETSDLLDFLDKLSTELATSIKLQDALIDELIDIKQLAWVVRNAAGDAVLEVTDGLNGRPLPANAMDLYVAQVAKARSIWAIVAEKAKALTLPASFAEAYDKGDSIYFKSDYIDLGAKTLRAVLAGQPPGMTSEQWTTMALAKLTPLQGVAEVALDVAKDRAAARHANALNDLIVQLALLVLSIAAAVAMMAVVSRRVISPLHELSGAMRRLAGGDFEVVLPGLERKDEIGEIAGATEGFKVKAAEKAQREAAAQAERERKAAEVSQREAAERAAKQSEQEREMAAERDAAMARLSSEFEAAVGGIVQAAVRGDFTQRVAVDGKSGLVLNVGSAINTLCANVSEALDDLAAMLGSLAEGDLTRRINGDYQGCFATLKDSANSTAERVAATIAEIKQAGAEVASAAAEISASTSDLSQRTEEQAASLEETSASMEQMSVTVKKNADQAKLASQFAGETRVVADRSGAVVAEAVNAMSRIDDSSRKIADIITVIDEIARQTNLLALNAAVEAARAGEAGRGFAVVAAEVRSLAQRSSQAAKDIKDLITNSSTQVKEGVDLVNRTGSSLNEIVGSIKKVADIVADIATASAEQSTGIDQVNKALAQVDEVTQQNSALVEENAATAKTLEHQAAAMNERVGAFRLDDAMMLRRSPPTVPAHVASHAATQAADKAKPKPVTAARPQAPVRRATA